MSSASAAPPTNPPANPPPNTFPTKTDKPRPHVCNVCTRSFARLEHLKRHERSHTKEKPFECPICKRCFARRDLLLRHQQKLHKSGETSTTRPKTGRRESIAGTSANTSKIRKNSTAGSHVGISAGQSIAGMRPRANTIGSIDPGSLQNFMDAYGMPPRNVNMHSHHPSLAGFGGHGNFDHRGMVGNMNMQPQGLHGLPKIDTNMGMQFGGGLRTAPPIHGSFEDQFRMLSPGIASGGPGPTINPQQLHSPFPNGIDSLTSFGNFPQYHSNAIDDSGDFDWDGQMMMGGGPGPIEHAIDESSPSAVSATDQSAFSEVMADGSNNNSQVTTGMWQQTLVTGPLMNNHPSFDLENMTAAFAPEINALSPTDAQISHAQNDFSLSSAATFPMMNPTTAMPGMQNQYCFPNQMVFSSESPSGPSSMNSSARQSSVTSISSDTITDSTRQGLIASLSQMQHVRQRKFSQPTVSSPLSPNAASAPADQSASLPSTVDLQRYVKAYIQYFQPHLPFLHIPTLSFESPTLNGSARGAAHPNENSGKGDCLILSMAAIGALYEYEHTVATELFESAKSLVRFKLDEHRTANVSRAATQSPEGHSKHSPLPIWIVQAFLLNLVFGHNCGDKNAAHAASTHCASLVSLMKGAGLANPTPESSFRAGFTGNFSLDGDMSMGGHTQTPELYGQNGSHDVSDEYAQWVRWKAQEERKRTFYAVYVMSSLLVTAYGHQPAILNSEIRHDLPCEEPIWTAESAQMWVHRGGAIAAQQRSTSFAYALSYLLHAKGRTQPAEGIHVVHPFSVHHPDHSPEPAPQISTFGCYVLIHAIHIYIWETRQRHATVDWSTTQALEMRAQIEPALVAWQAAWHANPNHGVERPNPYGPLSADCIPLLDCAYVRLFVDIGRTKDAIWQRDYDLMAHELARGITIGQGSDSNDSTTQPSDSKLNDTMTTSSSMDMDAIGEPNPDHMEPNGTQPFIPSEKRERHIRKAAHYAADSLIQANNNKVTYADFDARELPLQSAICTFECSQILAEWIAAVQDRFGRYTGIIIGRDNIDFKDPAPNILLDEHDQKLLRQITEFLSEADRKLSLDINTGSNIMGGSILANLAHYCSGSKVLFVAAHMLEKAGVWPVITNVIAHCLRSHAEHLQRRAEESVNTIPKQESGPNGL